MISKSFLSKESSSTQPPDIHLVLQISRQMNYCFTQIRVQAYIHTDISQSEKRRKNRPLPLFAEPVQVEVGAGEADQRVSFSTAPWSCWSPLLSHCSAPRRDPCLREDTLDRGNKPRSAPWDSASCCGLTLAHWLEIPSSLKDRCWGRLASELFLTCTGSCLPAILLKSLRGSG